MGTTGGEGTIPFAPGGDPGAEGSGEKAGWEDQDGKSVEGLSGWKVRILNPAYSLLAFFLLQASIWHFFMPAESDLKGVSFKVTGSLPLLRFCALNLFLFLGIILGRNSGKKFHAKRALQYQCRILDIQILPKYLYFSLVGILIGEIALLKVFILQPSLMAQEIAKGFLTGLGEVAKENRVEGLVSLVNFYPISIAMAGVLLLHPSATPRQKKIGRWATIGLFVWLFLHATLLSQRVFVIQGFFLLLALLLAYRPELIKARTLVLTTVILVGFIWIGECLRFGLLFSILNSERLFSLKTQGAVLDRLLQGYLASDFNNAMVIMKESPSYQMIMNSAFRGFVPNGYNYSDLPGWTSQFGTVNFIALTWFDMGWLGCVFLTALGWVLGLFNILFVKTRSTPGFAFFFYMMAFSLLPMLLRSQPFLNTIFIVPLFFLLFAFRPVRHALGVV